MKNSYPIILTKEKKGFTVFIPDFNINTQGDNLTEAIEMSRDAIGLMGIDIMCDNKPFPTASTVSDFSAGTDELISLVDVDFDEYKRKHEMRVVKKNCTLPSWLCYEAEKANINFSQILQTALKKELQITDR